MEHTIHESFILPSQGKIYDVQFNPEIKLRSMTTNEEMKRLSRSDKMYENMAEIIDDCLLTKLPISAYDLCFGDYQFLLHKLRTVTYGNEYKVSVTCPYCYHTQDITIDLDALEVKTFTEEINKYRYLELPVTKKQITLKFQSPRALDIITIKNKEQQKRTKSTVDYSILYALMSAIDMVDGERLDLIQQEEFVLSLPMKDVNLITKHIEKMNSSIGVNTDIDITCESCGLAYTTSFRITPEFYGPSIDI